MFIVSLVDFDRDKGSWDVDDAVGPFDTKDQAIAWAQKYYSKGDWHIRVLSSPNIIE